jgi:hypothetical protein
MKILVIGNWSFLPAGRQGSLFDYWVLLIGASSV